MSYINRNNYQAIKLSPIFRKINLSNNKEKELIAEIIINSNARALNRIFDYIVPKDFEESIFVGARVYVPFGRGQKLEDGFVIGIKEQSEFANKEIAKIVYEMSLDENKITLAKLMARKYFCNISDCIKLMLPPGTGSNDSENWIKEKTGNFVYLAKDSEEIEDAIASGEIKSEKHKKVLNFLLENDGVYISDLENFTEVSKSVFKTIEKNGYIEIIEKQIERNPFINKNIEKDEPKILNEQQRRCYESISFCIENSEYTRSLIHGITGSRKNRNLFAANWQSFRNW